MKYKGTLTYSEYLPDLADELAVTRSLLSSNIYNENTEKFRGEDENRISKQGFLGELIAREHFKLITKPTTNYKFARIIDSNPLPEPDLKIRNFSFDIKCIANTDLFMVNEKAFLNKDKKVDFYWFIRLLGNCECQHWIVRYDEVAEWELKQFKYTKAYWSRIQKHLELI